MILPISNQFYLTNLLEDVAVFATPMVLIEAIQINKAYKMRLFCHENAVKAKALGELSTLIETP